MFVLDQKLMLWVWTTLVTYRLCLNRVQNIHLFSERKAVGPWEKVWVAESLLHMSHSFLSLVQEWKITRLSYEYDSEPFGKERDAAIKKLASEAGVEVTVRISHTLYDLDKYVCIWVPHTQCHMAWITYWFLPAPKLTIGVCWRLFNGRHWILLILCITQLVIYQKVIEMQNSVSSTTCTFILVLHWWHIILQYGVISITCIFKQCDKITI